LKEEARRETADKDSKPIYCMDEEILCRLLGYLFGDASMRIKRVKGTEKIQTDVIIECADRAIVEDFSGVCRRLLERDVGSIGKRKRSKNWRATYTFSCKINKEWRKRLFGLSPTYRTKPYVGSVKRYPNVKIPGVVFKNKHTLRNFLQAMVNSEGSVQLRVWKHNKWFELLRYVKISCSHPTVLDAIHKTLNSIGVDNRKAPKRNPNSVIIQKKEAMRKFSNEIGFMKGIWVSRTGLWKGHEKRDILNLAIKTFDMPRGHLQRFNTEKQVYWFLRRQLSPGNGL